MDAADERSFGALLREFRLAARLSQEALAERAGMSARGISDLERGIHRAPYQQTVNLLVEALGLDREQRAVMAAAARRTGRMTAVPLRPQTSPRHNLPEEATTFIGRTAEVAMLKDLLQRPQVRLVTLTGPGGSGKTRLALRTAANVLSEFTDGVFFVSLAALTDPQVVPSAIAAALTLREREGRGPMEAVLDYLSDRNVLLVMDNIEHLPDASALLPELLEHCPKLHLLVTSRVVLRLSWEFIFEVQPLAVPDPGSSIDLQALSLYEGVALFVERARAADPAFTVTGQDAAAVAEICGRLDGLPLAIELAAARLRVLPPQALLGRLSHRLTFLTGGARDRPSRQQTLRAAMDWSYSLLDDSEQRLFARLAVFAGGCTLEAAEVVGALPAGAQDPGAQDHDAAPVPDTSVLDCAASLIDKSLLRRNDQASSAAPHLRMLETIRDYALERLEDSGEEAAVRRQHATYFLSLAGQAAAKLHGPSRTTWLNRLEDEHDNLRAALRWAREHREVRVGLRLAVALEQFWELRGYLSEGARWLAELLAIAGDEEPELKAAALRIAGNRTFAFDISSAAELTEQSLALYRQLADERGAAEALYQRGLVAFYQADYGRAADCLAESLALARGLGDTNLVNRSLWSLAWPGSGQDDISGDIAETKKLAEESLERSRQVKDPKGMCAALEALLYVARMEGDPARVQFLIEEFLAQLRHSDLHPDADVRERLERIVFEIERMAIEVPPLGTHEQAMALLEEGLALSLREGDRRAAAHLGVTLALFAREQGWFARAESLLQDSLVVFRELEDVMETARTLIGLADVARDQGDGERGIVYSQEGLARARECGDVLLTGYALHNMGVAAWQQGDYAQAKSLLAAALIPLDQRGEAEAEVLASIGLMALDQGDFPAARTAFTDSLRIGRTRSIPWLASTDLEGLAAVAARQGEAELAARLYGAADAVRKACGTPVRPSHQDIHDRGVAAAKALLGLEEFTRAYQRGQATPAEQMISDALS
jgi:predicted ATPase/transcriptional regulator with XRE-family HTH domain/tetratricopeptide (TPR) repeat protein